MTAVFRPVDLEFYSKVAYLVQHKGYALGGAMARVRGYRSTRIHGGGRSVVYHMINTLGRKASKIPARYSAYTLDKIIDPRISELLGVVDLRKLWSPYRHDAKTLAWKRVPAMHVYFAVMINRYLDEIGVEPVPWPVLKYHKIWNNGEWKYIDAVALKAGYKFFEHKKIPFPIMKD